MTFEEFGEKLSELVAEAIQDDLSIYAVLGALKAEAKRVEILWTLDAAMDVLKRRIQPPGEKP